MRSNNAIKAEIEKINNVTTCQDLDCMTCPHSELDNREAFNLSMKLIIELLLDIRSLLKE